MVEIDVDKDKIIGVLAGLASIVLLVTIIYMFLLMVDACCSSPYARIERVSSPVQKKARLWGLSIDERTAILAKMFAKNVSAYRAEEEVGKKSNNKTSEGLEVKRSSKPGVGLLKSLDSAKMLSQRSLNLTNKEEDSKSDLEEGIAAEVYSKEEDVEELDEEQMEHCCAICLLQYKDQEKIVTGIKCDHMFHYDCLMEWLRKGHDCCPYCREDMMTAKQMYDTAVEVLGKGRVLDITGGYTCVQESESTQEVALTSVALSGGSAVQPPQESEGDIELGNVKTVTKNETPSTEVVGDHVEAYPKNETAKSTPQEEKDEASLVNEDEASKEGNDHPDDPSAVSKGDEREKEEEEKRISEDKQPQASNKKDENGNNLSMKEEDVKIDGMKEETEDSTVTTEEQSSHKLKSKVVEEQDLENTNLRKDEGAQQEQQQHHHQQQQQRVSPDTDENVVRETKEESPGKSVNNDIVVQSADEEGECTTTSEESTQQTQPNATISETDDAFDEDSSPLSDEEPSNPEEL